ncbi:MAG: hypothetical protein LBC87_09990, partial [Fibromonadaceae bacterium]|nr:hypothetical protein [Fibromonadaceae bacterium]
MKKLLTREIIKRIIREPLFYLLPLLVALAGFWIIPAKSNISNVVLTIDGNSYSESFPFSTHKIKENSDFLISFNIDVKDNKNLVYRFYPDDCILGIEINGRAFPQEKVKEPCAYKNGTIIDFSGYTQKGLNRIELQMKNNGGVGGLVINSLHFHSVEFKHIIFSILLLITFVFILRKFKVEISVTNLKKIPFYILPVIALLLYAFVEFCLRLQYELNELFNMDTTIYQAVGRGIVNGIKPWSGLWDIKPPGIFLLNAISYKIFETPILTDYFQCFVLIVIAVIPILFWLFVWGGGGGGGGGGGAGGGGGGGGGG